MGSRSSRNGKARQWRTDTPATAPAAGATIAVSQIVITESERAELRVLEDQAVKLKCQVAEITFGLRAQEQQRDQVLMSIQQVAKTFDERVAVFARAHGIDVDDPQKGKWTFDGKEGTFTRTDLPGVTVTPAAAAAPAPSSTPSAA